MMVKNHLYFSKIEAQHLFLRKTMSIIIKYHIVETNLKLSSVAP
jgi:hypothetical protein